MEMRLVGGLILVGYAALAITAARARSMAGVPSAGADGSYRYRKTVSLEALRAAFTTALGDRELDLDRRVVFIHGVPDSTALPATVQSLGMIPAQLTLPIACGVIARVAG
jgi:hypothetical protein